MSAITIYDIQMKEYRLADEQTGSESGDDQAEPETKQIDAWQQYIADYEADELGDVSMAEQTVDEEFMAYNNCHGVSKAKRVPGPSVEPL